MTPSGTVFLLGAGFNADASVEARATCRYPLAPDLAKACFGFDTLPMGFSIEDLFADAIRDRRSGPMIALADLLIDADHEVGMHLRVGAGNDENLYLTFLRRFPATTFLTFNYDSLIEMLLLSLNRWRPEDGYGMPVRAELPPYPPPLPDRSKSAVLHLHGTLMVYPQEFVILQKPGRSPAMLRRLVRPAFLFDPDALEDAFFPFQRVLPLTSFRHPDQRVISPIPDKSPELSKVFARAAYHRAAAALSEATQIIAIGYRFGPCDRASYEPLLNAVVDATVTVVSPDAVDTTARLSADYPSITWLPVPATFATWVRRGYCDDRVSSNKAHERIGMSAYCC